MSEERISNRQLTVIIFLMRTFIIVPFLPVLTTADAMQDSWISAILAMFMTIPLLWLMLALSLRHPRQTLVEFSVKLLGPWLGRGVSIIYLWLFLWIVSTELRMYGEVIITGFLTETPLIFVVSVMIIAAAIAAYLGIEVIGRMADALMIFFVLFVVTLVIMPGALSDYTSLEPILGGGWLPVIRGAITPLAMTAQVTVLFFLIPSLNEPEKVTKSVIGAITLSFFLLSLATVYVIGTLGPEEGFRSSFPYIRMIRSLQFSEFLQRLEVLVIFSWGLGVFFALSVYIFCGARGVSQILNLSDYRPLIPPMAVIWAGLTLHNYADINELSLFMNYRYTGPYIITLTVIPLIILWTASLIKKR